MRLNVFLGMLVAASLTVSAQNDKPLWKSKAYCVYADSIRQGNYVAKAISPTQIVSNYQSPVNLFQSADISFKFSINGKDNEMVSGTDHHLACIANNGEYESPLIKFGTVQYDNFSPSNAYLSPNTKLRIRLDMRDVMNAFAATGFYTTFKGEKIYKEDMKGVYVAGSTSPLIWDFDNLVNHPHLQLYDENNDGIYEATLLMNAHEDKKVTDASWSLQANTDAFPRYRSPFPISDAIYNLSIEEMVKAVEPDSTFRTGKEWAGVWTRDVSYSIILSMAHLQPKVAFNSLMRKVNAKKRIIQDTGTGGAWPVSTDRMVWAVAAWELYEVTGDKTWLQQAQEIIKNSIEDDLENVYDPQTGLVKGESSFLDWREQTYPKWMQPADIFESENLGTNAVHYKANMVLGKMSALLGDKATATKHFEIAKKIKDGINNYLWQKDANYYGQYLYGRVNKTLSPRWETLGEALCILFDIADTKQQQQIVSNAPQTDFGIPCIYPQIPNIPPYHNNAVWPFVQGYWMLASAKAGNEKSVMESISAIYRPAAMFVTNKENFVSENGDFLGTQINSSNMLWSLSGSIAIVHKVLFGIQFSEAGVSFKPFVPKPLQGKRSLYNFKYRDAVLNIDMKGYGNMIKHFFVDGKEVTSHWLPAGISGMHHVEIVLANRAFGNKPINKTVNYTSLPAPEVRYENGLLQWNAIDGAIAYKVLKNGRVLKQTAGNSIKVIAPCFDEYQVIAVDRNKVPSFASEPMVVAAPSAIAIYEAENYADKASLAYKGFSGEGFIETSTTVNKRIVIPVNINKDGKYLIDCRYANGNGPTNTENKCAVRTLLVDNERKGTWALPQRGKAEWSAWGYGNGILVSLSKGKHDLVIEYKAGNENMNGEVNQAMIDYVRVIQLEK
jgi:hypothetical protein